MIKNTSKLRSLCYGILFLFGGAVHAQNIVPEWGVMPMESNEMVRNHFSLIDNDLNTYTMGWVLSGSVYYQAGSGMGELYASRVMQKMNAEGEVVWAKEFYPGENININSAVVSDSHLYIVGSFHGEIDFGLNGVANSLGVEEQTHGCILKYDLDGNLIWVKSIASEEFVLLNQIALDGADHLVVTGQYAGVSDVDPGQGTYTLDVAHKLFVEKLTTDGDMVWAKEYGPSNDVTAYNHVSNIIVDELHQIYLAGYMNQDCDMMPGEGEYLFEANLSGNAYLQKLDADGSLLWIHNLGAEEGDMFYDIALGANGILYTVGKFSGEVDIDPGAEEHIVGLADHHANVLAAFDTDGGFLWSQEYQMNACTTFFQIAADQYDNVYLGGYLTEPIDLNPTAVEALHSENTLFLSQLKDNGNFEWVEVLNQSDQASEPNFAYLHALFTDTEGGIYINGTMQHSADFHPGEETFDVGPSTLTNGMYHVKYKIPGWGLTVPSLDKPWTSHVYPNPTEGAIQLDFQQEQAYIRLVISDVTGCVVMDKSYQDVWQVVVEMPTKPAAYFLEIENGEGQKEVKKIMRQ